MALRISALYYLSKADYFSSESIIGWSPITVTLHYVASRLKTQYIETQETLSEFNFLLKIAKVCLHVLT